MLFRSSEDFNGMMRLNESGAFAFRLLQEGVTEEALVTRIVAEYDVSEEAARADVNRFLARLQEADALE